MTANKISIVLPCYKAEKHIDNIVRDVLSQSYSDWELLIISNGPCQDAQLEKAKQFAENDPRIHVLTITEAGVSKARQQGLYNAKGEWIIFIDADDRVEIDWLSNYIPALKRGVDIVFGGYKRYYVRRNQLVTNTFPKNICGEYANICDFARVFLNRDYFSSSVVLWNKMFSLEFLRKRNVHFDEDLTIGDDSVFCTSAVSMARGAAILNQSGYVYYVYGDGNAMNRYHASMELSWIRIEPLMQKLRKLAGFSTVEIQQQAIEDVGCKYLELTLNIMRKGCRYGLLQKARELRRFYSDPLMAYACGGRHDDMIAKLFFLFYRIKSPFLCVSLFSILYKIKHHAQ